MADDQLHAPLAPRGRLARLRARRIGFVHVAITLVLAVLAAALVWAWRTPPPPAEPVIASRELPPRPPEPKAEMAPPQEVAALNPQEEALAGREHLGPDGAARPKGRVKVIDVSKLPPEKPGMRTVPQGGVLHLPQQDGVRLARAPQPDLVEKSAFGPLPKVGRKGRTPAKIYARPVPREVLVSGKPKIAVVVMLPVSDTGMAKAALDDLPGEVSLAIAAHDGAVGRLMKQARAAGHETLLLVPMEPWGYPAVNPGPDTLLANSDAAANRRRLLKHLGRAVGYVGIMPLAGQKLLQQGEALSPILHELKRRGLAALDVGLVANSLLMPQALVIGLPAAKADVLIPADAAPAEVRATLAEARALAQQTGRVIIAVQASRKVLDALSPWLAALKLEEGLHLVPASALINRR